MENETVKLEQEPTLEMDVSDAIQKLAETMVSIAREQGILRQMLTQIIEERKQIADLVTAQDVQIKLLAKLQTSDHAAIEVLMASRGNGMGDSLAN
jgi:hypothetical protein